MEIDGVGTSHIYEPEPAPEPPPSETAPDPVYQPPQDSVQWPSEASGGSVDSSAAAWIEGTIAAAEAYAAMAPKENEFANKTAEERAQDAFWEHDPNRPATTAPQAAAPPPRDEEDDTNYKHPGLKPEEPPSSGGPVEPLPGGGTGQPPTIDLTPKPPAPTPPHLDFPKGQAPAPTPTPVSGAAGFVSGLPVVPTRTTAPDGTGIYGVRSNPPPTPPSNAPPERRDPPPSMVPDSRR